MTPLWFDLLRLAALLALACWALDVAGRALFEGED